MFIAYWFPSHFTKDVLILVITADETVGVTWWASKKPINHMQTKAMAIDSDVIFICARKVH